MVTKDRIILSGMNILFESRWVKNHALIVEDGRVRALILDQHIHHHLPAKEYHFARDHYLIPGLIDCHIHGANNYDVMDGTLIAFEEISQALAKEGVTRFLATTMTASSTDIEHVVGQIAKNYDKVSGAKIAGIHLEGPFLSAKKSGAQNQAFLIAPDWHLFSRWQSHAKQFIKIVTLAPELQGAIEFIKNAKQSDVVVSIGHTSATYEETRAAIAAGAHHVTHLFNAMPSLHHREPGPLTAILLRGEVTAEVIVDGHHVHPAVLSLITKVKGHQSLILVTDAMRAKCMADGQYELGGQTVTLSNEVVKTANNVLAGSVLSLPAAIKNMMQFTNCLLEEAIRMATIYPARLLGMDNEIGSLAIGKAADCVVLNKELQPVLTLCAGRKIFGVS